MVATLTDPLHYNCLCPVQICCLYILPGSWLWSLPPEWITSWYRFIMQGHYPGIYSHPDHIHILNSFMTDPLPWILSVGSWCLYTISWYLYTSLSTSGTSLLQIHCPGSYQREVDVCILPVDTCIFPDQHPVQVYFRSVTLDPINGKLMFVYYQLIPVYFPAHCPGIASMVATLPSSQAGRSIALPFPTWSTPFAHPLSWHILTPGSHSYP
jgi:hypothetical protein